MKPLMCPELPFVSEGSAYPYHKAKASPFEFCMQFPHKSSADGTISRNDCAPLIPYFASNVPIGPEEITLGSGLPACVHLT